ncbi:MULTISPECIES: class I SAM-dependent rRNA methyltransferase [Flavobacterium]|uniref:Class I SAM-dependent rRNA methyltransferase n=1 Tax=Flavobacterium covae TaxID=2906076 RepID=A0ABW8PET4_9FLAO|nr:MULTISPECIES: class I SAM-dependent rRNA methyltransferase [Flavobacterium]AMA47978.1 SAM-dependent methyltransferase [Flavobacterium covae]MCJ1810373.1 class I SAM-dependent rRNA methyltransferase [Flavobacterium covae]OWP81614.1 rRNA large subunit methyltransferase I [Flavobacterium covae]POR23487.1 rRNA large subunit methyltransferase I [Flavobacterium columnare]
MSFPKVILKQGKEKSILRRHPWIFSGAVYGVSQEIKDGEMVEVVDAKNQLLGTGYFSDRGSIVVRLLTFAQEEFTNDFWTQKLISAWNLRTRLLDLDATNAFRVIHGEGDGIPGLIIDFYNNHWVLQAHSSGIYYQIEKIAQAIQSAFSAHCETIYCKSTGTLPNTGTDYFLYGNTAETIAKENHILFSVNWVEGQKTGFFLDQRDNRKLLAEFSKGKKVLNTFCYTGGFSIYAMKAGAELVTSVDISQKAVDLAAKNMELNFPNANHQAVADDVFNFMKENHQVYDLIVLDPPAFAKSIKSKHTATQAYKRLNIAGLKALAPKGILFTFSCSQVIDDVLFYNTIAAAAIESGRTIRVLHKLEQGPDHPTNIYHPEGHYLKGLVLYVE